MIALLAAVATLAAPSCEVFSDAQHAKLTGARVLTVNVADEAGKPAEGDVTVFLAEGPGAVRRWRCTTAAKNGVASFQNLPDRDLVVFAADEAGRRAPQAPAPLGRGQLSLKLARPSGGAFLFDAATGRCADAGGKEGLNEGRRGECGRLNAGAGFDAPHDRLAGSDWSSLNLSGRDFTGARLARAKLRNVRLSRARLSGADLQGASLEGVDLTRALLRGTDLRKAKLVRVVLQGADLTEADLRGADLNTADLRGVVALDVKYDGTTKLPFTAGKAYRLGMIYSGETAPKIDEGSTDPSFRAFRQALVDAVKAKDNKTLAMRLTAALRQRCGAQACLAEIKSAIEGGGIFTDEGYNGFLAPAAALVAAAAGKAGAGGVWFSKQGDQWKIVEIGAAK